MAHQVRNLCLFSVFHCVDGSWCGIQGYPKTKKGARRDELKNGRGRVLGHPLNLASGSDKIVERRDEATQKTHGQRLVEIILSFELHEITTVLALIIRTNQISILSF